MHETYAPGFVPFELERLLAVWENRIEYNLSESGVHPMTVRELLDLRGGDTDAEMARLADVELNYPQVNGDPALREAIAALYPCATADNVLVTVGAIQANFGVLMSLTAAGDDVAVLQPNYQQFWGLTQNTGRILSTFSMKETQGWALDAQELAAAVKPSTKLVTVVNPNNPTGRIMPADERRAVVEAAAGAGAWLVADEVYAGAERVTDEVTPTLYGDYERVVAIGSLSKAYGLPGLRLGWVVAPPEVVERVWAWQDYVTIASTKLANELGAIALSPDVRPQVLARTRACLRRGFETVERWAAGRDDIEVLPPDAAAVCFARYHKRTGSRELVMRLLREKSAFVCPGASFGLEHHLRISFGLPQEYVSRSLDRLGELLDEIE